MNCTVRICYFCYTIVFHLKILRWCKILLYTNELQHDKTKKRPVRPAKTSMLAWRKPWSLATHWAHSEDWSVWANAKADLSLGWVQMPLCGGFVMLQLNDRTCFLTVLNTPNGLQFQSPKMTQLGQKFGQKLRYFQRLRQILMVFGHPSSITIVRGHLLERERERVY